MTDQCSCGAPKGPESKTCYDNIRERPTLGNKAAANEAMRQIMAMPHEDRVQRETPTIDALIAEIKAKRIAKHTKGAQ